MKIIVTGAAGRLGGALVRLYENVHEVTAIPRRDLCFKDEEGIRKMLGGIDFDVLINPAALTNVDYCEDHHEEAHAVNARAPRVMAEVCRDHGARMIHVSTDYVFDGEEPGYRVETDPTNPRSEYGRTKLAGEEAVLDTSDEFLVVRTSWVFGPERKSFLDMIVERAVENESVEAIEDKYSSPCYADDYADLLEALMAKPEISGILHLCNSGSCSWKEYGQVALEAAREAGIPLKATKVVGISVDDLEAFVAPRPIHSAMSTDKFTELTGVKPRPWEVVVEEYVHSVLKERLG